jgi:septum formation protein
MGVASLPPLVLASASPARLGVLRRAGFDPVVAVSGVKEAVRQGESPREHCGRLARAKAAAVAAAQDEGLVIGCDSMLVIDGLARGKPASADEARRWWKEMSGRPGTLLTGHCLVDASTGRSAADIAGTTVRFGKPTKEELDAYLQTREPLSVAGSFTIEGFAGPFVDGVDGDPNNVLGLSLPLLRRLVEDLGYRITDFWVTDR